jgi:hypothetical protein
MKSVAMLHSSQVKTLVRTMSTQMSFPEKWPFVPSTRCTCVMIMLFNQLLDMPHLSYGWIILAKDKSSPTGM